MRKQRPWYSLSLVGVGLIGLFSFFPHTAVVVGTIESQFQVDQNGAANLTIPIAVPPGRNGRTPQLTLIYDSHGSNGILGAGWKMGGISVIQRCAIMRNNVSQPVAYAGQDRYCLDGMLLVPIGESNGTVTYHTEMESWRVVTSAGSCGNGPCQFQVVEKSGLISAFGATDDARIEAVNGTAGGPPAGSVRLWAINKTTDDDGNFLTYSYTENSITGEFFPTAIQYTGSEGAAQSATNFAVAFAYDPHGRPDPYVKYQGGAQVYQTQLLTGITTCLAEQGISGCVGAANTGAKGFTVVSTYTLAYETSALTARSLLQSVTLTGADGTAFTPLQFTYQQQQGAYKFAQPVAWSNDFPLPTWASPAVRTIADVNGDGRGDIVGFGQTQVYLSLANIQNGQMQFQSPPASQDLGYFAVNTYASPDVNPRLMADVNGDGMADIIGFGNACIVVGLSQGTGFQVPQGLVAPSCAGANICKVDLVNTTWEGRPRQTADINGDGKSDLIGFGQSHTVYAVSNGTCFDTQQEMTAFSDHDGFAAEDPRLMADVNGDGLADIVAFKDDGTVFVGIAAVGKAGVTFTKETWGSHFLDQGDPWNPKYPRSVGDVNGDGLADVIGFGDTAVIVALSTGKAFTSPQTWSKSLAGFSSPNDLLTFGDINGDGVADVIGFNTVQDKVIFGVAKPRLNDPSFTTAMIEELGAYGTNSGYPDEVNYPRFVGDANGDGTADIIGFGDAHVAVALGPGPTPDLMTHAVNGLGGTLTVNYQSISSPVNSALYMPADSDCTHCRPYQNNLIVVAEHVMGDGRGNQYTFTHQYAGARWDLTGHGFLGFTSHTAINHQANTQAKTAGVATKTNFHQQFPLTGTAAGGQVFTVGEGTVLMESASSYCSSLGPTCPGQTYPGVFIINKTGDRGTQHSLESQNTYTVAHTYHYDPYGNLVLAYDQGNIETSSDDLYHCTNYQNDPTTNHLGYVTETIVSTSCSMDTNDRCSCAAKSNWQQTAWNDDWNPEYVRNYDDQNDSWLGTIFTYDAYGNVITQDHSYWVGNQRTSYQVDTTTYDTTYNLYPVQQANALFAVRMAYDARFGALASETDQNGLTLTYNLDGFGRITTVTGPNLAGQTTLLTTIERDTSDNGEHYFRRISLVDWDGTTASQDTYVDGMSRQYRVEKRTSAGRDIVQEVAYDDVNRVARKSLPYFKGDIASWMRMQYDPYNRVVLLTNPDSNQTSTTYDIQPLNQVNGPQITVTEAVATPDARVNMAFLDVNGRLLHKVYPRGDDEIPPVARYMYDALGRLQQVDKPGGTTLTTTYDSLNRQTQVTTTEAGTMTYEYNKQGQLSLATDALNQTVTYTYDPIGRVKTVTPLRGTAVTYHYDESGHGYGTGFLTSVAPAENTLPAYEYSYGPNGWRTAATMSIDQVQFGIGLTYTPQGKVTDLTYPDGSIMQKTYALEGLLAKIALCDGRANCQDNAYTTYAAYDTYNALGQPTQLTYAPSGLVTAYTYYTLGQPHTMTVFKGDTALLNRTYGYNGLYAITSVDDGVEPVQSRRFAYDAPGYLSSMSIGTQTWKYGYDGAGNLTEKEGITFTYRGQQVQTGTHNGVQVYAASYNGLGNISQKTITDPGSGQTSSWSMAYDVYSNLTEVKAQAESETTSTDQFIYDYQGRLVKKVDDSGTVTYYLSRYYEATVLPENQGILYTKYLDGVAGNVAQITSTPQPGEKLRSQLPFASHVPRSGRSSWLAWLGWHSQPPGSAVAGPIAHTVFARVVVSTACLALLVLTTCTVFGAAQRQSYWGHLRQKLALFLYHHELLSGAGAQRLAAGAETALVRQRSLYAYLTPVVLLSFFVSYTSIAQGSGLEPGKYGYGVPEPGVSFFSQDQVGSTTLVTASDGSVQAQLSYLPYGALYDPETSGTDTFRAKFDGREWDRSSQLYYFAARFYDPLSGRFLGPDDRLYGGPDLNAAAVNRYAFADNNAITYSDPSGHSWLPILAGVAAAVAIGGLPGVSALAASPRMQALGLLTFAAWSGGKAMNHASNPLQWNWKSWKTYAGMGAGIGITLASVAIGAAVAQGVGAAIGGIGTAVAVDLGAETVGALIGASADLAGAVASGAAGMAANNAAFSALGGGSGGDILRSAAFGAVFGAAMSVVGKAAFGAIELADFGSATSRDMLAGDMGTDAAGSGSSGEVEDGGCNSFAAGTAVALPNNDFRNIEDIQEGDVVRSWNPTTGEVEDRTVTQLYRHQANVLLQIDTAEDTELLTTPEHPFRLTDGAWKTAAALRVGDLLTRADNSADEIVAVHVHRGRFWVYNFAVTENHSYFVSAEQLLVHNCNGPVTRSNKRRYQETLDREGLGDWDELVRYGKRPRRGPSRYDGSDAPQIKLGTHGGPTAGQAFAPPVRAQTFAENPRSICVFCRGEGLGTQVDHAWPRSLGGDATIQNAQLACPHCNVSKGTGLFPVTAPSTYYGSWPPPWAP